LEDEKTTFQIQTEKEKRKIFSWKLGRRPLIINCQRGASPRGAHGSALRGKEKKTFSWERQQGGNQRTLPRKKGKCSPFQSQEQRGNGPFTSDFAQLQGRERDKKVEEERTTRALGTTKSVLGRKIPPSEGVRRKSA